MKPRTDSRSDGSEAADDKAMGRVAGAGVEESPRAEIRVKELGGREGPDPTRYGDWEKNGRCIDF